MKIISLITITLLTGTFALLAFLYPHSAQKMISNIELKGQNLILSSFQIDLPLEQDPVLDTSQYAEVLTHFSTRKIVWTSTASDSLAGDSLSYILGDSLAPYWIGTPWDFNGVSKHPQKGSIACGYFVYGLLEDAGFNLPRIKLSQATSENSIKAIVSESHIKRFSNKPMDEFITNLENWGEGIYLVGLDYHIGLIQVKGTEISMIHSSVYYPGTVVIEDASSSLALINSNYRILGKVNNPQTINKWLKNQYFSM